MKSNRKLFFKIIIIIFVLILVTYCISVVYKYVILSKIASAYEESKKIENYSYSYMSSTSNNTIYKFDNITKITMEPAGIIGKSIYWSDSSSGEQLEFMENENEKIYFSIDENISNIFSSTSLSTNDDEKFIKFIIAMNPFLFIRNCKYNNIDCYDIYYYNDGLNIEKIDKKTGLILFSDYVIGGKTYYKYNFNDVTSKDVEKPDTNLYTYKNME